MGVRTISSSQIGHTSLWPAPAVPFEGPPILMRDARSWGPKSGTGVLEDGGEMEAWEVDSETELESDGA